MIRPPANLADYMPAREKLLFLAPRPAYGWRFWITAVSVAGALLGAADYCVSWFDQHYERRAK